MFDALHARGRKGVEGMNFWAQGSFDAVSEGGGNFGETLGLSALVSVHGNVCSQGFLGGVSI